MQKLQKLFRKIREKVQAKLLFEPIRKAQRQCKQRWYVLKEITRKLQKKNKSPRTTLETENGIISDRNAIAEEFNTFFYEYRSKFV